MRILFLCLISFLISSVSFAREIEYLESEVTVYVTPGEPTQIQFVDDIKGGVKPSGSAINVERKGKDLVVFAKEELRTSGEAIIVTLKNDRSYSLRIKPVDAYNPRDDMVQIIDKSFSPIPDDSEVPAYKRDQYPNAPTNSVSGLMREMALFSEFGKSKIPGYRVNEQHKGEVILDDGTMLAVIDKIFIGSDLWGYVINTQNMLDSTQQINPATFRVDGTRAVNVTSICSNANPRQSRACSR